MDIQNDLVLMVDICLCTQALPISIFTAMIFYFVSRYTLVEYLREIVNLQLII